MTTVAPFEFLYPVFKHPGTPFLRVAFIASVRVKFIHFSQAGSRPGPVRGVAIRAFQRPLDDAVVVGKIKLGLHVPVAGEAEVWVFFLQEFLSHFRRVNLMTVITTHSTELMDSSLGLKE